MTQSLQVRQAQTGQNRPALLPRLHLRRASPFAGTFVAFSAIVPQGAVPKISRHKVAANRAAATGGRQERMARQDNGSSCIGCEGLTGMDSAAGGSGWTCPKPINRFSSRAAAAAFMLFKVSSFCSSLILISLPGVVCFPFFSSCPWTTNPSREAGALALSIRSTTFKMRVSRHRCTLSRVSASPSHCPLLPVNGVNSPWSGVWSKVTE